jgi:hypothetical protein
MKTCDGCGKEYGHAQKWWHDKCEATNSMANAASNTPDVANDKASATNGVANESNTYKYRDPEKRRAYQREYMRNKRAKK